MKKNKNDARKDFIKFVMSSWTWERLTEEERGRARAAFNNAKISGNYCQRKDQLNSVYGAFLLGLGYNGLWWREPAGSDAPQF